MSSYIGLFVALVSFIIGSMIGFSLMIPVFHYAPARKTRKSQSTYHAENEKALKQIAAREDTDLEDEDFFEELSKDQSENEYKTSSEQTGLLKKRLGKERESWTDFNCTCDEVDENEYIRKSRKQGESSYHYAKTKK